MLDVLYPLVEAVESGGDAARIRSAAHAAADATVPMVATRGRASFLGERSAGHMDPGARSSALLTETITTWMENRA
jgi:dihydroxyacetone kinase-like protein